MEKKIREIIKKRNEHIAKNLAIAKERNAGFEENSLAYILAENRKYLLHEKRARVFATNGGNKTLKELENKILENERRVK